MPKRPYKAIAAMAENRVIGNQGDIPWHLPEDFKWFKKTTMGGALIMGRKTYESIGRPLPGRDTYVLSRSNQEIPKVQVIADTTALEDISPDQTIWIAGGGEIYKWLLPLCDELYLSRVHKTVEGDAYFPEFEHLFDLAEAVLTTPEFTVERWTRKR